MKLVILIAFLYSLSSWSKPPSWFSEVNSNEVDCKNEIICTVGEGDSLEKAISNARGELAKFFQTKVEVKSDTSSLLEQLGTNAASGAIKEWASKTISEESTEVIRGSEVKLQEKDGAIFYVLVGLNRRKSIDQFQNRISELDLENSNLINLDSRFVYPKILKNIVLIDFYSDRYNVLTNKPILISVKKEKVQSLIQQLKPITFFFKKKNKSPESLNHALLDVLAPLKVVSVTKENKPQRILISELKTENQYLKVSGFFKMSIVLNLELQDLNGKTVGKLAAISEQVARSKDQAIEKSIPELINFVQDNLNQLAVMK